MREQEIFKSFSELKKIKPRAEWVSLTKDKIFEGEGEAFIPSLRGIAEEKPVLSAWQFLFKYRPAFASAVAIVALLGVFGFTQNSMPGDLLFSIKKIAENSQAAFISAEGQSKYNLELASKRMDELTKMAKANNKKELTSAISEFQASVSKAAESLKNTEPKNLQEVKDMAVEIKKIEEKTETMKSLGVDINTGNELENVLGGLVNDQIKELEGMSLSDSDKEILVAAKASYENKDYSAALEEVLKIGR
jgi:hypothetical protein